MPELTVIKGDERAEEFLKSGATIVDFLKDPFRPCVVYTWKPVEGSPNPDIVASNSGAFNGNFFSCFWELSVGSMKKAYVLQYLADEKVVLAVDRSIFPPPQDTQAILGQRGACELCYPGNTSDIEQAFRERGYDVEMLEMGQLSRFIELEKQGRANLEARADEIAAFYKGLRPEGE